MKKLFFDGEFCDLTTNGIKFLSIAFVKENGESLYLEIEQSKKDCSAWVLENVVPLLTGNTVTEEEAKKIILEFVGDEQYQIIADVCQFDWMGICKLFGGPFQIPFFYIPIDLSSILYIHNFDMDESREKLLSDFGISIPGGVRKHNALYDALSCKALWEQLI